MKHRLTICSTNLPTMRSSVNCNLPISAPQLLCKKFNFALTKAKGTDIISTSSWHKKQTRLGRLHAVIVLANETSGVATAEPARSCHDSWPPFFLAVNVTA